jgi:hypothetical protein
VRPPNRIRRIQWTERFKKAYKSLSPEIQREVHDVLLDLVKEYVPNSRRMAPLGGYKNPKVFVVHVTSNHSHKMSFEIQGDPAILRTVDTHKAIDKTGGA